MILRTLLFTFLCLAPIAPALADPPHAHAHDYPAPQIPSSFAEALAVLTAGVEDAHKAITSRNIDAAGEATFRLHAIAESLGKIALKDPAVPRAKVKPINVLGKSLAEAAMSSHTATDAADLGAAAPPIATMRSRLKDLAAIVASDPFICAMHCEGTKTYDAPAICPICKMDLTPLSVTPYSVDVTLPKNAPPIAAGVPASLDIRLFMPDGKPVAGIDVVHEHPLHLIIVSEDLSFYAHVHPTRTPDGVFHQRDFTFPFGGKFSVFADFTPSGRPNQVVQTDITIPAGDTPSHTPMPLVENEDVIGKEGDYEFRIRCNGGKFVAAVDSFLRYGIDLKGQPVTDLEPLMGAKGHLVIISADRATYIHAHPFEVSADAADPSQPADHGHGHDHHGPSGAVLSKARAVMLSNGKPSDIMFHAVFPTPGLYRAIAQFQHRGRILTYACTIDAKSPIGEHGPTAAPGTPSAPAPRHDHSKHK